VISSDLFTIGIPVGEKVLRTVAVYGVLTVLLRLFGKRELAQLNNHDLVVMLLVSNVVQNAVIGPDNSLSGGIVGAVTLFAVNSAVVRVMRSTGRAERIFDGTPTVLVHDGKYDEGALRREGVRRGDLDLALHVQGANGVSEVAEATLSAGGAIVVDLKQTDQTVSRGDLDRLRRHLDDRLDKLAVAISRPAD
jgi:uncharacterized membrane protein YcaP (DUF421 family)